jgi:type IV pilus assembly protein PilY1
MKALLFAMLLACSCPDALPAPPLLVVPDGPLGLTGGRVHPNLLVDLSVTFADAGAAYRANYDRTLAYAGYFNPRMCYSYPMKRRPARLPEPDLDERSGYFSIDKAADARHECGADSFSGNFLNWASASTLDLLRYGLTGGDRVIDEPGLTVLQRAWLPDGKYHPDFYASATYFPRKGVAAGANGSRPGRVTPFDTDTLYVVSCRNRILFSGTSTGSSCDAPRLGAGGRRRVSDKYFGEFNARVKVCSEADSESRPDLCRQYAGGFKPEGSIQRHGAAARISLISRLAEQGANDGSLHGGGLRAPLRFVGPAKFEAPRFALAADRAGAAPSGTINAINQLGRAQPARMGAYESAGRAAVPDGDRADPVAAACRRNAVATISHARFAAAHGGDVVAGVRGLFAAAAARPGQQPGRSAVALRPGGAGILLESSFEESGWSGRLEQRALSTSPGGAIEIGSTPLWEAGALLSGDPAKSLAPRPPPQERRIYTLVRNPDQSTRTVPFTWDKLGREERAWLDLAPSSELRDGLGEARVAFLRGERSREIGQAGGVFRRRAGVLGDTIHSTPLLVGAPQVSVQGPGYDSFHARYKARASAIYLGANDGMLHAFDARDGAELFAYVPNALVPVLNQLGDPAYRHRPYVDASAGQGEASVNGQWRSVLVSGMGMGARGVFALDVSDPAAFDGGLRALWEFTEQDDPAIGHVSAAPLIAKIKVGMNGGAPEYRYFAVVSSGVNNYGQEAGHTDPGGALFLLALDKGATSRWKEGVNYYKLAAPASEATLANALATPALVTAGDGSARFAYAGDLQGKLWRFDFGGKPPFSSAPLFEARDEGGRRQPITQAPRVVFAPGGGYLVLFGTGKMIEDSDLHPPDFAPQSFYAVRDSAASPPAAVSGRGELARRTLSGSANYAIKGAGFDYTGAGAKKGWYFDFPAARTDGERLAASPVLASGTVFVTTIVPGLDPCAVPATRTYVLDALSGFAFNADGVAASDSATGRLTTAAAGALPMVLELGAFTGPRGATGGASATRKIGILHLQGGDAAPGVQQVDVSLPARRISWREVANWQELHDAAKK